MARQKGADDVHESVGYLTKPGGKNVYRPSPSPLEGPGTSRFHASTGRINPVKGVQISDLNLAADLCASIYELAAFWSFMIEIAHAPHKNMSLVALHDKKGLAEIRKESLDIYNRLHSIAEDATFVEKVAQQYSDYPVIRAPVHLLCQLGDIQTDTHSKPKMRSLVRQAASGMSQLAPLGPNCSSYDHRVMTDSPTSNPPTGTSTIGRSTCVARIFTCCQSSQRILGACVQRIVA